MTLIWKGTRAAAANMAKEFLQFDHKSAANGEEVKENYETLDSNKHERDIAEWTGRPRNPSSSNEEEGAEGKEEDVGVAQSSTEDNSPIDEEYKDCEYDQEDDRKDTVLSDSKNTEEESS